MNMRLIINSILAVGTVSLSPLALATPSLTIHNNTDFYSTVLTNGGSCSNSLPDRKGITAPHETKVFDSKIVRAACMTNSENCQADAYLTDHCAMFDPSAHVVASVIFSVNTGIKTINNIPNSGYCVKGSGFDVTLDPNPTNQPCN